MYHYVYLLTHIETNEFYIGVRSSKVTPEEDDYIGSMVTWQADKKKLKKETLCICVNRRVAEITERALIKEAYGKDLNRNFNFGGDKREKFLEMQELKSRRVFDMDAEIWKEIKL